MRTSLLAFFDRRDDRRARELREELGRRGLIVSWHRMDAAHPPGGWLARVSCRAWPETVERPGPSRRRAILSAAKRLDRLALDD